MNKSKKILIGVASAFSVAAMLASCGETKKYTINFVTNGGAGVSSITVEWGGTFTLSETTRTGYTFVGWYTDAGLTNPYDTSTVVEEDFTLYAKWAINKYTVNFSTGDEAVSVDSVEYNYDELIDLPTPTKDYYTFEGWYLDEELSNKAGLYNKMPANDMTFYAKWTPNSIAITFDKNDEEATGEMAGIELSELSEKNLPECSFKKVGYDFVGWALEDDKTKVVFTDKEEYAEHIVTNGKVTLYAVWAQKDVSVSYFAVNSENNLTEFEKIDGKYGDVLAVPNEDPEVTGFEFKGWGTMVRTEDTSASIEKEYFTRSGDSDTFIKMNYTEGEDLSSANAYEVSVVNLEEEVYGLKNLFYARFERKQTTVNFVSGLDGTVVAEAKTGYFNTLVGSVTPNDVSHYSFSGKWFRDASLTEEVSLSRLTFGAEDITLYAKYDINKHNASFIVDGRENEFLVEYGTNLSEVYSAPEKTGYTFEGWYLDQEFNEECTQTSMPDNDLVLYAKYQVITYKINVHNVDGVTSIDADYGVNIESRLENPEKTGYTFEGWFIDSDFKTRLETSKTMPNNNFDVYAKFEIINSLVKFDVVGGSYISDITLSYGVNIKENLPTNPSKTGYIFAGWFLNGSELKEDAKMGVEPITLVAQWVADDVDVTVNYISTHVGGSDFNTTIADSEKIKFKSDSTALITKDNAKEITGFTFKESPSVTVKPDGSSAVNVYYTRNTYNVTFKNKSTGETIGSPVGVEYEGKLAEIPEEVTNVSKVTIDYEIDGEAVDFTKLQVFDDVVIDVIYTEFPGAIFDATPGKFGDGKSNYLNEVVAGDPVVFPEDPTYVGHTFEGFYVKGDTTKTIVDSYTMPEGGVQFVALWTTNKYTISFETGFDDVVVSSIEEEYGKTVSLPAQTKTGYTLDGWYLKGDDNQAIVTSHTIADSNATYVAKWTENKLTVSFNANSGEGNMDPLSINFTAKESTALPTNAFGKTGHTFLGWSTDKDASVPEITEANAATYRFDDTYFGSKEGAITLYAVWSVNQYTITFNSDGGSLVSAIVADYNSAISAPTNPTKTGYDFGGWFNVDEQGEIIADSQFVFTQSTKMGANNITLKAKWIAHKHSILFDTNGGDAVVDSNQYDYGTSLSNIAALQTPTKEGHIFQGWYTEDSGYNADHSADSNWGTKVDATYLASHTMGDSDITFHAMWIPIQNTVTYYVNGSVYGTQTVYYGDSISEIDFEPTERQVLDGWYQETDNGFIEFIFDNAKMGVLDIELHAKFYEVAYYGDGSNNLLYQTSTTSTYGFMEFVSKLYNESIAYADIYEAINDAVAFNQTKTGDQNDFLTISTYAQLGGLDLASLQAYTGLNYDRTTILVMASCNTVLSQGGTPDQARIIELITELETRLPYSQYALYYQAIVTNGESGIENTANITSAKRDESTSLYFELEHNAYNPVATEPGKYFDGWTETSDDIKKINKVYANYVAPAKSVSEYEIVEISDSSVTFAWEEIANAYGYRISATKNGTKYDFGDSTYEKVVTTNTFKFTGLITDDVLKVTIVTLKADESGNYKEYTAEYTATSVSNPSITLKAEKHKLDSEPVEFEYNHTIEADIDAGAVSKSGQNFYIVRSDTGVMSFICFTNCTYPFSKSVTLLAEGNTAGVVVSGSNQLSTGFKVGEFKFIFDGVTYNGYVRQMPSTMSSGAQLSKYELTDVSTNARSIGTARYLNNVDHVDSYKIGTGSDFRFDVNTISETGRTITIDRQYKFYDASGTEITDVDSLYDYNEETDSFRFKQTGKFSVQIMPKLDEGSYVNKFIPQSIKDTIGADGDKFAKLTKTFAFELVEGVNVTTNAELRAAFDNNEISVINVHSDITAKMPANSYVYLDDRARIAGSLYNQVFGEDNTLTTGEARIVPNTAVMKENAEGYPNIWRMAKAGETPVFVDALGDGYVYDANGGSAIIDAEFVQDFYNGNFKGISFTENKSNMTLLESYGYRSCNCYARVETNTKGQYAPLTVNGNYFAIDGSKVLFNKSKGTNSAGDVIATYKIQTTQHTMILNCCSQPLYLNNLSLVGNVENKSAQIDADGKTKNVAEIMEQTSGGVNGVRTASYTDNKGAPAYLKGVNISNCLIGFYTDQGGVMEYSQISNSWANTMYCCAKTASITKISNSIIGSSGGCAMQPEDERYEYGNSGTIINDRFEIDFASCKIENFVSGDEPWFKGYSMEVIALGMKSTMESQVSKLGYTIIKEVVNPNTGLASECMNWVYFDKADGIKDQKPDKNANDIGTVIDMSEGYSFYLDGSNLGQALITYAKVEPSGIMRTVSLQFLNPTDLYNVLGIDLGLAGKDNAKLMEQCNASKPIINPIATDNLNLVINCRTYYGLDTFDENSYLFFRQFEGTLKTYISGMVELYKK